MSDAGSYGCEMGDTLIAKQPNPSHTLRNFSHREGEFSHREGRCIFPPYFASPYFASTLVAEHTEKFFSQSGGVFSQGG